jgi:SAM-dependent methyltransferase
MKTFDERYFKLWYRTPGRRVRSPASLARQVTLAVAVAEYVIERPLRRVLDVGCGEGEWGVALKALRPRAVYAGIEPSTYAVERFGAQRNLRQGSFGTLGGVTGLERFDLIVCSDVLHYVERSEIIRGAGVLGERLHGVALLHAFTRSDDIEGDLHGLKRRPAKWYRDTFRHAGLTSIGLGCWVGAPRVGMLAALERA